MYGFRGWIRTQCKCQWSSNEEEGSSKVRSQHVGNTITLWHSMILDAPRTSIGLADQMERNREDVWWTRQVRRNKHILIEVVRQRRTHSPRACMPTSTLIKRCSIIGVLERPWLHDGPDIQRDSTAQGRHRLQRHLSGTKLNSVTRP